MAYCMSLPPEVLWQYVLNMSGLHATGFIPLESSTRASASCLCNRLARSCLVFHLSDRQSCSVFSISYQFSGTSGMLPLKACAVGAEHFCF